MGRKKYTESTTIRVPQSVHDELKKKKRGGETFGEMIARRFRL